jgi:hypothetical protein
MLARLLRHRSLLIFVMLTILLVGTVTSSTSPAGASDCQRTYVGSKKGLVRDSEWHHYVEFDVDISAADGYWSVSGPLSPSLWPGYYGYEKRAGYRWPSNWWSPYSAKDWTLCLKKR